MNTGFEAWGHRAPARVQALASRNLQVLQAIENTVSCLSSDVQLIHSIAGAFEEIHGILSKHPADHQIDPEGVVRGALAKASAACVRMHNAAKAKHRSACEDHQLRSEDGVTDAYEAYLTAVDGAHDCIEGLKEWIATHDAILEPDLPGSFSDVDALFEAMGITRG